MLKGSVPSAYGLAMGVAAPLCDGKGGNLASVLSELPAELRCAYSLGLSFPVGGTEGIGPSSPGFLTIKEDVLMWHETLLARRAASLENGRRVYLGAAL